MQVIECLAVLDVDVSKQVVLSLKKGVVRILASKEFSLLEQPLDLIDCELAFHVA